MSSAFYSPICIKYSTLDPDYHKKKSVNLLYKNTKILTNNVSFGMKTAIFHEIPQRKNKDHAYRVYCRSNGDPPNAYG